MTRKILTVMRKVFPHKAIRFHTHQGNHSKHCKYGPGILHDKTGMRKVLATRGT